MSGETKEAIDAVLDKPPYFASIIPRLEAYVAAQVAGEQPYSERANRTLLKQYRMSGVVLESKEPVANVMLLALLQFPSTDFTSFMYLVPDGVRRTEPCSNIAKCHQLLTACNFAEFWKELGATKDVLSDETAKKLVDDSTDRLRMAILSVFALTYRSIPLSTVLEAFGETASSAEDLTRLASPVVESVNGDTVTFVPTSNNTKRRRTYKEGVGFSSIATMMSKMRKE